MDQFFVHQVIIGRFRLSLTGEPLPIKAGPFPADVEKALAEPESPGFGGSLPSYRPTSRPSWKASKRGCGK